MSSTVRVISSEVEFESFKILFQSLKLFFASDIAFSYFAIPAANSIYFSLFVSIIFPFSTRVSV